MLVHKLTEPAKQGDAATVRGPCARAGARRAPRPVCAPPAQLAIACAAHAGVTNDPTVSCTPQRCCATPSGCTSCGSRRRCSRRPSTSALIRACRRWRARARPPPLLRDALH